MSNSIVPNKEEKENIFGNMIIEQGINSINSINEENNLNQENINNIKSYNLGNENDKKTNFISKKTKNHKNHYKQKGEISYSINLKSESSSSLKNSLKSQKNKNIILNEDSKNLSINNKIDQSNSSLNNHQNNEEDTINNITQEVNNIINIEEKEEINKENEISVMNIEEKENIENNININININYINGGINEDNKENVVFKPSLTWNIFNDPDSDFVPMEYMNDIWDSLLEKEKYNIYSYDNINKIQTDIKESMRCILIDWLISLQNKFFLNSQTLFLTVNLIDRYLSRKTIYRTKFQLLGVTALFIASKYEEMYMKNINEFVEITARTFDKFEILKMESELIDLVDFNLDLPLSIDFFGVLGSLYKFNKKEFTLGYFLLESYLLALNGCKYKQSIIGLATCYIILGIRKMQNINPNVDNNFIKYYSDVYKINFEIWNEKNLIIECAKNIYYYYDKKNEVKYREVYNLFHDLFI